MFYQQRRPTFNTQSPFGGSSMNVPYITDEILERLTLVEMQLSVLMSQAGVPQAFYKPQAQPMFTQPGHTTSHFYPTDGFDTDAFKRELEPFTSDTGWPSLEYPVIKAMGSEFNTTVYMVYNADGMVYITSDDKIYTTIKNATQLPVTKSNYKNLELHPLFVRIFDKLAELEKANVQSNGNVNVKDSVIDDTMILESILDLSGQRNISLTTITTLFSAYRWYQIFKTEDAFPASFKEAVVKYQAELRKIKVHTQPLIHTLKNLEQAFNSLLPDDGSVDLSDVKQTAIHLTISTIKSLISEEDE